MWHVGFWFPDQGWTLHPLQWKRRVLTIGPEGKSPYWFLSKQFIESAMTPREEKIMDQKAERTLHIYVNKY